MPKVSSFVNGLPVKLDIMESYFYIDEYDAGKAKGGIRRWNEGHEEVMRRFYAKYSPPIVSASRPHEHQEYLDEHSFASRQRGRAAVSASSRHFKASLLSPDFAARHFKPFESKSVKEREELVLNALAGELRTWHLLRETSGAEWQRKLLPEINLADLCSGDGKGLRRLVNRLGEHLDQYTLVDDHPFPHAPFFRKFGLNQASSLPLSPSCRAYQDEVLLIRHSMLLNLLTIILNKIADGPPTITEFVGNVPQELKPSTAPHLFKNSSEGNFIAASEKCAQCNASAKDAGISRLLRCGTCLKVGRIELYCSSRCQRIAWNLHKKTCGAKLSEALPVPNFAPPASSPSSPTRADSTTLHPLRRFVPSGLDAYPTEIWHLSNGTALGFDMGKDADGIASTTRVRAAMRATAYKALRDSDPVSIDVLACSHVPYDHSELHAAVCPVEPSGREGAGMLSNASERIRADFKAMFDLDDEQLAEAIKRGEKELEKPERRGERELWVHKQSGVRRMLVDMLKAQPLKKDVPLRSGITQEGLESLYGLVCEAAYHSGMHKLEKLSLKDKRADEKKKKEAATSSAAEDDEPEQDRDEDVQCAVQ
ncbi:hypothetical protein JCM8097_003248 [Rhodosporidiobolus ruineniae]